MKVTERTYSDQQMSERDYIGASLEIEINDKTAFSISEGDPEDMTLNRDLHSCYGIISLMKEAYEAGKNGEEFIVEKAYIED